MNRISCRITLWSAAFAAAVFVVPTTGSASPVDLFGYGARGTGMAGAVTSTAEGHEGVYYNPALLALETNASFFLGYQRSDFNLEFNGDDADVLEAPATVIGVSVPVPFGGLLKDRLTIGLGFVLPQKSVLLSNLPRPGQPRFVVADARAQTVSLQGAAGVRVTDWLSLGIGFLALAELEGNINVAPNSDGRVGAKVGDNLLADYSPVFGIVVQPWRSLSIGLSARGQSTAEFTLPITVDLGENFQIPVPELDISGIAQYDPRQVALEVSYRPVDALLVAAGAAAKQWSTFKNPIDYAAVPEDFPRQPDANFKDILILRAGLEGTLKLGPVDLRPRGGFAYEPSPTKGQVGFHNYLDSDRFIMAGGFGATWEGLHLDLAAQWHLMPEQTDDKVPGDPDSPLASELTSITYGGSITFVGVGIGVDL